MDTNGRTFADCRHETSTASGGTGPRSRPRLPSPVGVAFALTSGAFMATYLVLNKRAGARRADGSDLTWAVVFAAVLVLPLGPAFDGRALFRGDVLLAGAGTALVSAVVPWSLDQAALRRLPERVVAVMVSLEPAAGAVAGLLVLGEHLSSPQWFAVACVSAASAGAVVTHSPGESAGSGRSVRRRQLPGCVDGRGAVSVEAGATGRSPGTRG